MFVVCVNIWDARSVTDGKAAVCKDTFNAPKTASFPWCLQQGM